MNTPSRRERVGATLIIGLGTAALFSPFNLFLGALLASVAVVLAIASAL